MNPDDIAGKVHETICHLPRHGGRDPDDLPAHLLDLPEARAARRTPLGTLLLLAALVAMYALNLPRRAEPISAHAAPSPTPPTIEGNR